MAKATSTRTPGPWKVGGDHRLAVCGKDGKPLAMSVGTHSTAARANIRLMAASPDLLEVVRLLVGVLESTTQHAALTAAKKLIRKVEGRRNG